MPNKNEVIKGTAATEYQTSYKYDMGSNSPNSVAGGSAATNFPSSPKYNVEKLKENAFDSIEGGSAATNKDVNSSSGTATNDRAK